MATDARVEHDYVLTWVDAGTRVQQRMAHGLEFEPLGRLMDAAIVRRRWNAGIEEFLRGLKQLAETKAGNVAP